MAKHRLKYNPRRRTNDQYVGPWYIWLRGWVGPFKTATGAVRLDLYERPHYKLTPNTDLFPPVACEHGRPWNPAFQRGYGCEKCTGGP